MFCIISSMLIICFASLVMELTASRCFTDMIALAIVTVLPEKKRREVTPSLSVTLIVLVTYLLTSYYPASTRSDCTLTDHS